MYNSGFARVYHAPRAGKAVPAAARSWLEETGRSPASGEYDHEERSLERLKSNDA
jgi:hypothetical protein